MGLLGVLQEALADIGRLLPGVLSSRFVFWKAGRVVGPNIAWVCEFWVCWVCFKGSWWAEVKILPGCWLGLREWSQSCGQEWGPGNRIHCSAVGCALKGVGE